jgi:plastocyanin
MRRFRNTLAALVASLCALALLSAVPASANHLSGGPRTWQVLIGAQSTDGAIQAEGYYPRVITIDAGDTVVWTLNSLEIHSVVFMGSCGDFSCLPDCNYDLIDLSPCGSSTYDGVSAVASSGRMVPPQYNWDDAIPHGSTAYPLTFTKPGTNVYFDLSVSGMRGVVLVNPAGTPYPHTQSQYSQQAQQQIRADIEVGPKAEENFKPIASSANPDGTLIHHVALGTSGPETAGVELGAVRGSPVEGHAVLKGLGVGSSPSPTITVKLSLSGLKQGSVHAVQILLGVCGAPAPTSGLIFSQIFNPPTFVLASITARADGSGTSTTVLNAPPNANGPGQFRIPSAGWFINVADGATPDDGATSAACGNIAFHNAAVMRYLPQTIHVHVGDTVEWVNQTINEVHGVTFLTGQALPQIPDWYFEPPTATGASYDGSTYASSGSLYPADAGRAQSFALTFTKAGTFSYVDVGNAVLGMQGSVVVTPN